MRRFARTGVWIAFAAWLAVGVSCLSLTIATWDAPVREFAGPAFGNVLDIALGSVFAVVGLILAANRPGNVVGWLLYGVALSLSLDSLLARYAVYGLLVHPGALPGAAVAAALRASTWVILISALALLLLTFPNGRLPSRRWRVAVWTLLVVDVSTWSGNTLVPGPLPRPLDASDNPLGIETLRSMSSALSLPGWLMIAILGAGAVSLVQRFRRSQGDERLQYKWFTFAAALFPVAMVATQIIDSFIGQASTADAVASTVSGIVATVIPVATAVAVLRYRLYEIDRIVSRAVVYALLTVVLGGAYVGLVLGSQAALTPVARGSSVAVALSTLVVAALFMPVRARVQRVVDRRFYRRRYDAIRTLDSFSARLREQVDVEVLRGHLIDAVDDAMKPAHVQLWVRETA